MRPRNRWIGWFHSLSLQKRLPFVAAPHAGGDDARRPAFGTNSPPEVTASVGTVGKDLTGTIGQGIGASSAQWIAPNDRGGRPSNRRLCAATKSRSRWISRFWSSVETFVHHRQGVVRRARDRRGVRGDGSAPCRSEVVLRGIAPDQTPVAVRLTPPADLFHGEQLGGTGPPDYSTTTLTSGRRLARRSGGGHHCPSWRSK